MAPLVPDIISPEFNFMVAVIVGFGFGYALEQAGFSSTKKLVGLFYGYDFTVLRVFFTAGITAMIGVLLLHHFGLLNISLIYINPTFLWSAIVGGAIMGAGFIIGGFCPGTSICAMSIGKIDGFFFVIGSVFGVFIFTEVYPLIENFYKAEEWGEVRINEFFNMSASVFALIMTVIALGAFYGTSWIQSKVTHTDFMVDKSKRMGLAIVTILPLILILVTFMIPDREERIERKISDAREQKKCVFKEIEADKLAYEMVHNSYKINLIDVRPPKTYKKYHLPLAINIPLDSMLNLEYKVFFTQNQKRNIFYSDVDTITKMACLKAKFIGDSENYILRESTQQFKTMIMEAELPGITASKDEMNLFRYRSDMALKLNQLEKSMQRFSTPVKKKVRKIQGGCS